MMYSCAVFEHAARDAASEAQIAKLDADLRRSSTSGPTTTCWRSAPAGAAFAVHAAATRGCRVTTTTISREQHDHAVARVRAAGLEDRVTVLLEDYRDLDGQLRQARLDRDDRGGRLAALRHVLRALLASCWRPTARCCCRRSRSTTAPTRSRRRAKSFINTHDLPRRLPALAARSSRAASRAAPTCTPSTSRTSPPHYAETLRRWRDRLRRRDRELARARLRRALPPAVAAVPGLLRGGLRRAPDRRRAAAARQATVAGAGQPAGPRARRAGPGGRGRRVTDGRASLPDALLDRT